MFSVHDNRARAIECPSIHCTQWQRAAPARKTPALGRSSCDRRSAPCWSSAAGDDRDLAGELANTRQQMKELKELCRETGCSLQMHPVYPLLLEKEVLLLRQAFQGGGGGAQTVWQQVVPMMVQGVPLLSFLQETTFEPLPYSLTANWRSATTAVQDPVMVPPVERDTGFIKEVECWLADPNLQHLVVRAPSRRYQGREAINEANVGAQMRNTLWAAAGDALSTLNSTPLFTGFVIREEPTSGMLEQDVGLPDTGMCIVHPDGVLEPLVPLQCKHRHVLQGQQLHTYTQPEPEVACSIVQCLVQQVTTFMKESRLYAGIAYSDAELTVIRFVGDKLLITDSFPLAAPGILSKVVFAVYWALQQGQRCLDAGVPHGSPWPWPQQSKRKQSHVFSIIGLGAAAVAQQLLGRTASNAVGMQQHEQQDMVLHRCLGEGAVGIVCAATYQGEEVAVKIVGQRADYEPDGPGLCTELRAYEQLAAVQGAAVPRVISAGVLQGPTGRSYAFLAMSRVGDGVELLDAAAEVPLSELPRIAQQASRCLQLVHGCGVTHGDVGTPGNVVLDVDVSPKLLDFSHADTQPTEAQYQQDRADLQQLLVEVVQARLGLSPEDAAARLKTWLDGL